MPEPPVFFRGTHLFPAPRAAQGHCAKIPPHGSEKRGHFSEAVPIGNEMRSLPTQMASLPTEIRSLPTQMRSLPTQMMFHTSEAASHTSEMTSLPTETRSLPTEMLSHTSETPFFSAGKHFSSFGSHLRCENGDFGSVGGHFRSQNGHLSPQSGDFASCRGHFAWKSRPLGSRWAALRRGSRDFRSAGGSLLQNNPYNPLFRFEHRRPLAELDAVPGGITPAARLAVCLVLRSSLEARS